MKRVYFVLFFTFLLFPDALLKYANVLYSKGLCYESVTEYKRFLFFNPDYPDRKEILYRIGLCLREEGELDQALQYFKQAMAEGHDKAFIGAATVLIARRDYESASVLLSYVSRFRKYRREAQFYLGISELMQGNYDRAIEAFRFSLGEKGKELYTGIEKLKHRKSPEVASFLARMLPGAGQLYAGSLKDFIAGILTSGVTLYFLGYHVAHEKFLEAILIYVPLFQRYYLGGEKRAAQIIREKEIRLRKKLVLLALSIFREGEDAPVREAESIPEK